MRTAFQNSTDQELVQRFRENGDNESLSEIYRRFGGIVLAVCIRILENKPEAQDAVSDIFADLIFKLREHEISNFRSWLLTTTRNHCLMAIRKRKNFQEVDIDKKKIRDQFMESPEYEHLSGVNQDEEMVRQAVEQLETPQRRCIELFYFQQKSYQEISQELGYDFNQVKSYLQNGKRNLKIQLSKLYSTR